MFLNTLLHVHIHTHTKSACEEGEHLKVVDEKEAINLNLQQQERARLIFQSGSS